jgi:hypothetical protein
LLGAQTSNIAKPSLHPHNPPPPLITQLKSQSAEAITVYDL